MVISVFYIVTISDASQIYLGSRIKQVWGHVNICMWPSMGGGGRKVQKSVKYYSNGLFDVSNLGSSLTLFLCLLFMLILVQSFHDKPT